MIEVARVVDYAHYASGLINGDYSGLDEADQEAVRMLEEDWIGWTFVSCSESFFGTPDGGGLPGEVVEYELLRSRE